MSSCNRKSVTRVRNCNRRNRYNQTIFDFCSEIEEMTNRLVAQAALQESSQLDCYGIGKYKLKRF